VAHFNQWIQVPDYEDNNDTVGAFAGMAQSSTVPIRAFPTDGYSPPPAYPFSPVGYVFSDAMQSWNAGAGAFKYRDERGRNIHPCGAVQRSVSDMSYRVARTFSGSTFVPPDPAIAYPAAFYLMQEMQQWHASEMTVDWSLRVRFQGGVAGLYKVQVVTDWFTEPVDDPNRLSNRIATEHTIDLQIGEYANATKALYQLVTLYGRHEHPDQNKEYWNATLQLGARLTAAPSPYNVYVGGVSTVILQRRR